MWLDESVCPTTQEPRVTLTLLLLPALRNTRSSAHVHCAWPCGRCWSYSSCEGVSASVPPRAGEQEGRQLTLWCDAGGMVGHRCPGHTAEILNERGQGLLVQVVTNLRLKRLAGLSEATRGERHSVPGRDLEASESRFFLGIVPVPCERIPGCLPGRGGKRGLSRCISFGLQTSPGKEGSIKLDSHDRDPGTHSGQSS